MTQVNKNQLSGRAFNERADRRPVTGADYVVALPMPDLDPIGNPRWAIVNHGHRHQLTAVSSIRLPSGLRHRRRVRSGIQLRSRTTPLRGS
jgi:hypothetical protein